jgi:hypothetical protein
MEDDDKVVTLCQVTHVRHEVRFMAGKVKYISARISEYRLKQLTNGKSA